LQSAVEAEMAALLAPYTGEADAKGHAAMVCHGYLPAREVLTGIETVSVRVSNVCSRNDEPVVFCSELEPPYVRQDAGGGIALVVLKGDRHRAMGEALKVLVGPQAKGLSASVISCRKATEDGRALCRYRRRWKIERLWHG
jgi:putative transposase